MLVNFSEVLFLDVCIFWHCDVNYRADLFFVVDQYDVGLIVVKQMLVSLDGMSQRILV